MLLKKKQEGNLKSIKTANKSSLRLRIKPICSHMCFTFTPKSKFSFCFMLQLWMPWIVGKPKAESSTVHH